MKKKKKEKERKIERTEGRLFSTNEWINQEWKNECRKEAKNENACYT